MNVLKSIRTVVLMVMTGGLIFITGLEAQTYDIHPLGINASTQDFAADKNGNLHIIWVNAGNVYYGRINNYRVTNQVKVSPITSGETLFCRPRIAVRNDGQTVHIVWGNLTLTHAWRDSGGAWHKETVRNEVLNRRYYGAICAVTPDEAVHVLYQYWNAKSPISPMIYLRKPNGGQWSSNMSLVPNANAEYRDPSVFVDSYGGLHASWRGLLVKPSAPYVYAPAGANLEDARAEFLPMASDVTHNAKGDIFVNEDTGRVHRVIGAWSVRKSIVIDYTYKNLGGSFASLTRPSIGDLVTTKDTSPTVAADSSGHVFVSYRDFVANKTVVYLSIFNDGSWAKYVADPNAGTTYNQNIKSTLTATENGVYCLWRSISGEVVLAEGKETPPSSSVTVVSPNNNEQLASGSNHSITWSSQNVSGNVDIYLYRHFYQVGVIASGVPVTNGSYAWTVGNYQGGLAPNGPGYKIRIRTSDGQYRDDSNGSFTITGAVTPSLSVVSPNGGESLASGASQAITWSSANVSGNVNIYLDASASRLGTIATGVPVSNGTYSWTVGAYQGGTAPVGSGYRISIETADGQTEDSSDGAFSIVVQQDPLSVTAPSAGETWAIGSTQRITWSSSGVSGNLKIYLMRGTRLIGTIATGVPVAGGGYNWKAGFKKSGARVSAGNNYRIKIVSASNARINALSNGFFTLARPRISTLAPGRGTRWPINNVNQITWTHELINGDVEILLYRSGRNKGRIAVVPVDDLSFSWTVGRLGDGSLVPAGSDYQIRIKSTNSAVTGRSRSTFIITK